MIVMLMMMVIRQLGFHAEEQTAEMKIENGDESVSCGPSELVMADVSQTHRRFRFSSTMA